MSDLLLTLGHNASAIAVSVGNDGTARVDNAYELERLTGVKSDSRFPMDAIMALRARGAENFDRVYVTHWDPTNDVYSLKSKYWDAETIPQQRLITQEMLGLTHHDCHAHAAVAFAGDSFPRHDAGVLVIDGFGNFGEHISYYRLNDEGRPMLIRRYFGYHSSLGLMYQYATAFLGMKMHEDEYKLLGYGARLEEIGIDRLQVHELAMNVARQVLRELRMPTSSKLSPALEGLPIVQQMWADRFSELIRKLGASGVDNGSFEARVIVGYAVQVILENVVMNLITTDIPKPRNLIMTGGVAFNVALNNMLLRNIPGKLCVMPIAGDQGNSLGLWAFRNRRATLDFGDLCWGKRDYEHPPASMLPEGLHVFDSDTAEVEELIRFNLKDVGFVNLVRGRMEFGPRALCNTTTLARADDPAIAAEINRVNGRDSVMPFAPVVWHENMPSIFPNSVRLHKSDEYMICAVDYGDGVGAKFPGAALTTATGRVTGRPQSYRPKYPDDSVGAVLREYGLLINTSFNVHGVPICCDLKDVVHSHQFQRNLNPKVTTIVITEHQ